MKQAKNFSKRRREKGRPLGGLQPAPLLGGLCQLRRQLCGAEPTKGTGSPTPAPATIY
eukprot:CAMPEP_0171106394 /NCGR_PEP_ID=MMETSP0766_2-20121228/64657_1 /TAXON_ID=439317 /ORGANISM="Gambierdiscus australes, Strain CAWD 149" /LENGTH=57 /DNA_ID=CAMNT_0011567479 /DNA_START=75 /DNA_END=245 /DNA_ORIENTATION=-